MKAWDILLSTVPTGFAGTLDALADTLGDCLDEEPEAIDSTISGDLETGQLDVHFEFRGDDGPVEAVSHAVELLLRALERCGAYAPGGTAQLAEMSSPVVGIEVHAMNGSPRTPEAARELVPA
jgi:hypothetical protein